MARRRADSYVRTNRDPQVKPRNRFDQARFDRRQRWRAQSRDDIARAINATNGNVDELIWATLFRIEGSSAVSDIGDRAYYRWITMLAESAFHLWLSSIHDASKTVNCSPWRTVAPLASAPSAQCPSSNKFDLRTSQPGNSHCPLNEYVSLKFHPATHAQKLDSEWTGAEEVRFSNNARTLRRYYENREAHLERGAVYRLRNHEAIKQRKWEEYHLNIEHHRAKDRVRRAANREEDNRRNRERRNANREETNRKQRERRAANRDETNRKARERLAANRKEINRKQRERRAANREDHNSRERERYRAKRARMGKPVQRRQ